MRSYILTYIFVLFLSPLFAINVFVHLKRDAVIKEVVISIPEGTGEISAYGIPFQKIQPSQQFRFLKEDSLVRLEESDTWIAEHFLLTTKSPYFSVQVGHKTYTYRGQLHIFVRGTSLQLINEIDIEDYLGPVLWAEIGGMKHPEFLKAMAVVSRTYALKNLHKYAEDLADLSDGVDCQVYKGNHQYYEAIQKAINATERQVIVSTDSGEIINAVFHANSGGLTSGSEHVWSDTFAYLQPVEDSFSTKGKGYRWQKEIPKNQWTQYLSSKVMDSIISFNCDTSYRRHKYFQCNDTSITLSEIRSDWQLRSPLFIVEENLENIVFYGRGYGHGVGLSQEGAYQMAQKGYTYDEIIHFYYSGVEIKSFNLK